MVLICNSVLRRGASNDSLSGHPARWREPSVGKDEDLFVTKEAVECIGFYELWVNRLCTNPQRFGSPSSSSRLSQFNTSLLYQKFGTRSIYLLIHTTETYFGAPHDPDFHTLSLQASQPSSLVSLDILWKFWYFILNCKPREMKKGI